MGDFLEEDLERYDSEISDLERKLSELKQEREKFRMEIEKKKKEKEEMERISEEKEIEKFTKKAKQKGISFTVRDLKVAIIVAIVFLVIDFVLFNSFTQPAQPVESDSQTEADLKLGAMPKTSEQLSSKLTLITVPECADKCISLDPLISELETIFSANNVTVSTETLLATDAKAAELISKYSIKKLPVLIVSGDTDKITGLHEKWVSLNYGSVESDGTLVVRSQLPIFFDWDKKALVGAVKMIALNDASCKQCAPHVPKENFQVLNIKIVEEKDVDISSEEGAMLLQKYNITKVPTVILSSDVKAYKQYSSLRDLVSEQEDGSVVLKYPVPLYHDLLTGKIVGSVFIIYIVDSECTECVSLQQLQTLLKDDFALKPYQEDVIEYSSLAAQELIQKYNISKIPSVVISGEVEPYYLLKQLWSNFGIVAEDGTYVFTNPNAFGKGSYRDLTSGEIVTIAQQG